MGAESWVGEEAQGSEYGHCGMGVESDTTGSK